MYFTKYALALAAAIQGTVALKRSRLDTGKVRNLLESSCMR